IGAADGTPSTALFNYPWDVTVDSTGNIFVMDGNNFTVRKISSANGNVSTYAGGTQLSGSADGFGTNARFNNATGITCSRFDKSIYIGDAGNELIRKISSVSNIQLTVTAVKNNWCSNDTVLINVAPSGLNNYQLFENGVLKAASANGSFL